MSSYNPFLLTLDDTNSVLLGPTRFMDEGGTESLQAASPSATRRLVCKWVDRQSLSAALGGGYDPDAGIYVAPLPHPTYPWLYPQRIEIEGIPGPLGLTADTIANQPIAGYEWARLRVTYGRYNFDPAQINQGDISIQYGNTVTAAPTGSSGPTYYYYDKTTGNQLYAVPSTDNPPILIPTAVLTMTRNNCGSNGSQLAFQYCGKVNKTAVFGAAPETLLFDGVDSEKEVSIGGSNQWTNRIRLRWNGNGWNTIWDPKNYTYNKIADANNKNPPFTPVDFSALTGFI